MFNKNMRNPYLPILGAVKILKIPVLGLVLVLWAAIPAHSAAISGTVSASGGQLVSATVYVYAGDPCDPGFVAFGFTEPDGAYSIDKLAAGTYYDTVGL